ncbi:MAG: PqqD family peptide modification chaperone [Microcoleaceae cyanobacterium]
MKFSLNQKVLLTDNFSIAEDEGEFFLVNLQEEGQDFLLDKIAATMLCYLIGAESIQEAYDDLLAEYNNVKPEVLKNNLLVYIEDLANDGIVQITDLPILEDEIS